jgi:hypothetical protein
LKGLLISLLVLIVIAAAGVGISAIVHINLTEDLKTAHARGLEEGYADGYEDGLIEGSIAGYQEGSKLGYQTSNREIKDAGEMQNIFFIYNPTYEEVQKILDSNDLNTVQEIIDYSMINGIRSAYVRCQSIPNEPRGKLYLYEFVGFETVDRGFVIIDPEIHREVKVEIGVSYSELNYLESPSYDDTIGKITIVW